MRMDEEKKGAIERQRERKKMKGEKEPEKEKKKCINITR